MDLFDALEGRRTIRRFLQTPVPDEALVRMIDLARRASCGGNKQQLRYLIVRGEKWVRELFDHTAWAALVKPRRTPEWGKSAPRCFIAITAPAAAAETPLLHADAGSAIQSMQLAAFAQGLGCCWIGAFDKKAAAEILRLPEDRAILYLLAVGYPDEAPLAEEAASPDDVKYYLDAADRLHVPKLRLADLIEWK